MASIGSHCGHGTSLGDPFLHADTLVVLSYPVENIDYLLNRQRSKAEKQRQAPEFQIQAIIGHMKGYRTELDNETLQDCSCYQNTAK
jgi:hypothetical protein